MKWHIAAAAAAMVYSSFRLCVSSFNICKKAQLMKYQQVGKYIQDQDHRTCEDNRDWNSWPQAFVINRVILSVGYS